LESYAENYLSRSSDEVVPNTGERGKVTENTILEEENTENEYTSMRRDQQHKVEGIIAQYEE